MYLESLFQKLQKLWMTQASAELYLHFQMTDSKDITWNFLDMIRLPEALKGPYYPETLEMAPTICLPLPTQPAFQIQYFVH